ncbi:hypothetical protein J5X84_11115 [Streptosporangiaceae bacterium NEAU-GS5]|nr:hypothetical protein [Streptosporangiaceae bacterium NEAU-GS5]
MKRVAYVTCAETQGFDDEWELVLSAWLAADIEGTRVDWADPGVDWAAFDAAVVRSAWNYIDRRDAFVAWAHRVGGQTRLFNSAEVIERNTDKTYLRELSDLGVPIVPTHWSADDVPEWDEYVVKPSISANARDTIRTADRDEVVAFARRLEESGQTVMIQPYIPTVEHEGEMSMLYFGEHFSHAVRRHPMLTDTKIDDQNKAALRDPDDDQFALAERVLKAVTDDLLYARVDIVRMPSGEPVLMELELTEPYLFLRYEFEAPGLLAQALSDRL